MLKNLDVKNKQVLNHLDEFLKKDYLEDKESFPKGWDGSSYTETLEYATSDSTLEKILENRNNFKKLSYNKIFGETEAGTYFRDTIGNMIGYDRYYTSAYIPKGFVGWHADDDIAGWYLMFTYATSDNGYFKYRDPVANKVITFKDHPGWMTRIGFLGKEKEIVWHCAAAFDTRLTILFLYDEKSKFDKAVKILQLN